MRNVNEQMLLSELQNLWQGKETRQEIPLNQERVDMPPYTAYAEWGLSERHWRWSVLFYCLSCLYFLLSNFLQTLCNIWQLNFICELARAYFRSNRRIWKGIQASIPQNARGVVFAIKASIIHGSHVSLMQNYNPSVTIHNLRWQKILRYFSIIKQAFTHKTIVLNDKSVKLRC
jgi:hypothetical protein